MAEESKNKFRPAAVIFDMDGLMLDTEKPCLKIWSETGKKFGYNITHENVLEMVGISHENARRVMLKRFGSDFPFDNLCDEVKVAMKKEQELNGVQHKKGLVFLLDRLASLKIPLSVATSSRKAAAIDVLTRAGIIERFAAITGGDDVANGKPAPDIFLIAADKAGADPCACIGFEDSPAGLLGLHSACIKSVFIKDLIEPPEEILANVWRRCEDLFEAAEIFAL